MKWKIITYSHLMLCVNAFSATPTPKTTQSSSIQTPKRLIPTETISRIKSIAPIVNVIETYGLPQFKKSSDSSRATAICPFHIDSNPSLHIDNAKSLYKCFSCGAGGDVFTFVREYDYQVVKKGVGDKMSYVAAIRKVAMEYCSHDDEIMAEINNFFSRGSGGNGSGSASVHPLLLQRERKERERKEQLKLVNTAAMGFYAQFLITDSSAGAARTYLIKRGTTPRMVNRFALGYAPDVYFGGKGGGKGKSRVWGEGSCVHYLQEMGFAPDEIVDAGLATLTSSARRRLQESAKNGVREKNIESGDDDDNDDDNGSDRVQYADLIDRFRDRLMIPIFDKSGKAVIGFGGRSLDRALDAPKSKENQDSSNFQQPKYLNSPESPIFSKKDVLYAMNTANRFFSQAIEREGVPTMLIVEGYFDAMTLHAAGIEEATACMGSSLTKEQLKLGTSLVGNKGKIIVCLDGDEAGINAVDRVCKSDYLWDIEKTTGISIAIATLPKDVKDPAEFIEKHGGVTTVSSGKAFKSDVMDTAIQWKEWYINHLLSFHDTNNEKSFLELCDQLSLFLSKVPNPVERTKMAYDAAGALASNICKHEGRPVSVSLQVQLESDLMNMALRKTKPTSNIKVKTPMFERSTKKRSRSPSPSERLQERSRTAYSTGHFSGFTFNPTDAQWLGLDGQNRVNGLARGILGDTDPRKKKRNKDLVYFNSNKVDIIKTPSMEDGTLMLLDAEALLLRTMIRIPSARIAMKAALSKSYINNGASLMQWSSSDREWLFQCLLDADDDEIKNSIDHTNENLLQRLLNELKKKPDVPLGAFGDTRPTDTEHTSHQSSAKGSLDSLFSTEYDILDSSPSSNTSEELRVELTIQRAVSIILKANAMTKLDKLKEEWAVAENERVRRRDDTESTSLRRSNPNPYESLNDQELEGLCLSLGEQVFEAFKNVNSLTESTKRLSSRILDSCQTDSVEGRITRAQTEKLGKMLDEHLASLPDNLPDTMPEENGISP